MEDCIIREVQEECGITLKYKPQYLLNYYPLIGHDEHEIFIYTGAANETDLPEEIHDVDVIQAKWFTLREIENMIENRQIIDGKTIIAYFRMLQSLEYKWGQDYSEVEENEDDGYAPILEDWYDCYNGDISLNDPDIIDEYLYWCREHNLKYSSILS